MKNQISVLFIPKTLKIPFAKKWFKKITDEIIELLNLHNVMELSIVITNNQNIHNLNKMYRGINEPTDVLAFQMPSEDKNKSETFFISPPDKITHLGEVVISFEMAKIQASQYSSDIKQELVKLLVHGILHLLNYDHKLPSDRRLMEKKEAEIIYKLNFNNEKSSFV